VPVLVERTKHLSSWISFVLYTHLTCISTYINALNLSLLVVA